MPESVAIVLAVLAGLAAVVVLYVWGLRPRSHRWGATAAEVARPMPGDELVPEPKVGYTQAITIDVPPEAVWPWLVQVGYGRAGWYTYDWVYRLLRANDFYDGPRSAERIIPELQDLAVGDDVRIFEQGPMRVVEAEPERLLVLLARVDTVTGESFALDGPMPAHYMNQSWAFLVEPFGADATRLTVRWRGDYSRDPALALALGIPTEFGALLMQPAMLRGIKARAETAHKST